MPNQRKRKRNTRTSTDLGSLDNLNITHRNSSPDFALNPKCALTNIDEYEALVIESLNPICESIRKLACQDSLSFVLTGENLENVAKYSTRKEKLSKKSQTQTPQQSNFRKYFRNSISSDQIQESKPIIASSFVNPTNLAHITRDMLCFIEAHYGKEAFELHLNTRQQNKSVSSFGFRKKLPISVFLNYEPEGPLQLILVHVLSYMATNNAEDDFQNPFSSSKIEANRQMKSKSGRRGKKFSHEPKAMFNPRSYAAGFEADATQKAMSLLHVIAQALVDHDFLAPIQIYFCDSVPEAIRPSLLELVHNVEDDPLQPKVVTDISEASHIIYPDPDGTTRAETEGQDFLNKIEIRGDKAWVHWWYYPDSYDSYVPASEVDPDEENKESDIENPSVRNKSRVRRVWHIQVRWLQDSYTFNEWMNEQDYIIPEEHRVRVRTPSIRREVRNQKSKSKHINSSSQKQEKKDPLRKTVEDVETSSKSLKEKETKVVVKLTENPNTDEFENVVATKNASDQRMLDNYDSDGLDLKTSTSRRKVTNRDIYLSSQSSLRPQSNVDNMPPITPSASPSSLSSPRSSKRKFLGETTNDVDKNMEQTEEPSNFNSKNSRKRLRMRANPVAGTIVEQEENQKQDLNNRDLKIRVNLQKLLQNSKSSIEVMKGPNLEIEENQENKKRVHREKAKDASQVHGKKSEPIESSADVTIRKNRRDAKKTKAQMLIKEDISDKSDALRKMNSVDKKEEQKVSHRSSEHIDANVNVEIPEHVPELTSKIPKTDNNEPVINDTREYVKSLLEKLRSQRYVPIHCDWFDCREIHNIEKYAFPEFFKEKNEAYICFKTPQAYMEYRNFMIFLWRLDPECYLCFTAVRKFLQGDVSSLLRIFRFLENWGLINLNIGRDSRPYKFIEKERAAIASVPISSVQSKVLLPQVLFFEDGGPQGDGSGYSSGQRQYLSRNCSKVTTDICSGCDLTYERERMQFSKSQHLCNVCVMSNKMAEGFEPTKRSPKVEEEWHESEIVLLLEALEIYSDNWEKVSRHVGTKSTKECASQFLKLPLYDEFMHDSVRKWTNGSYYNSSCSGTKIFSSPFSPCADESNPIMAHTVFLASIVSPFVARSSSRAALRCLSSSKTDVNDKDQDKLEVDEIANHKIRHYTLKSAEIRARVIKLRHYTECNELLMQTVNSRTQLFDLWQSAFRVCESKINTEQDRIDRQRTLYHHDRIANATGNQNKGPGDKKGLRFISNEISKQYDIFNQTTDLKPVFVYPSNHPVKLYDASNVNDLGGKSCKNI